MLLKLLKVKLSTFMGLSIQPYRVSDSLRLEFLQVKTVIQF